MAADSSDCEVSNYAELSDSLLQPHTTLPKQVDTYFLKHNNQPMRALYEALNDTANLDLPMAIVMDQRCGIERATEVADKLKLGFGIYLVGATPLNLALCVGRIDFAKALIAAGACLATADNAGQTPLHYAATFEDIEAIEALLNLGANREAADTGGLTPLHTAARFGNVETIEVLVKLGANHAAADDDGRTPLHLSTVIGRVGVIEILVKLDSRGQTPLHVAAMNANVKAIEVLRGSVAFEATLTAVDAGGQTPLQLYTASAFISPDDSKIRALLTPKR